MFLGTTLLNNAISANNQKTGLLVINANEKNAFEYHITQSYAHLLTIGAFGKKYSTHSIYSVENERQKIQSKLPKKSDKTKEQSEMVKSATSHITKLLKEVDALDVFILGHTNDGMPEFLEQTPRDLLKKVRLVYNTGCSDGNLSTATKWLMFGAKAYIGHKGASLSHIFLHYFHKYYAEGMTLQNAVKKANEKTSSTLEISSILDMGNPFYDPSDGESSYDDFNKGTKAVVFGNTKFTINNPAPKWVPHGFYFGDDFRLPAPHPAVNERWEKTLEEMPLMPAPNRDTTSPADAANAARAIGSEQKILIPAGPTGTYEEF